MADGTAPPHGDVVALVADLEEHLATRSLQNQPIEKTAESFCERARAGGLSIARMLVTWRLLNPLFFSQTLTWIAGSGVEMERFRHRKEFASPEWMRSPLWHVLANVIEVYRVNLAETAPPREFEVLDEFAERGFTDYITLLVGFGEVEDTTAVGAGVLMSVCSDRSGGFTDWEIAALHRLKYMIAVAVRAAFQAEIAESLARTYLGRTAGRKVLSGQITRGGGETVEAVIWYCDLRHSTALCERMGMDRYIPFLNDYFCATAGEVQKAGGEILDFIGDAVLAVFPLGEDGVARAVAATEGAMAALRHFRQAHSDVLEGCHSAADLTGIALDTGHVVYGNIGIPDRLTFSVIGPTVNRVARIEALTKALREPVLVTEAIAAGMPGVFVGRGTFALDGVSQPQKLFALAEPRLFDAGDGAPLTADA